MDKEFKIAIGLLTFLLIASVLLLEFLAKIHFWNIEFVYGFAPFFLLIVPYILFSSKTFTSLLRDWSYLSFFKKLLLPVFLLLLYGVSSFWINRFDWNLFFKLGLWLMLPTLLFSIRWNETSQVHYKDFIVALLIWIPIEIGQLSGFDIIFNENIMIPALPFAAPILGLYTFAVLRNLPGIGYTFLLQTKDLFFAGIGIISLAFLLVPLGTYSEFIHFSIMKTSFWQAVQLILGIYFLVALPEELLFRGIIQNILQKLLIHKKWGEWIGLGLAAIIFGLSHWNNFNPPDWHYVILASIAGGIYGWVYIKSGKTTASALVHCSVNFIWAILFKDTVG